MLLDIGPSPQPMFLMSVCASYLLTCKDNGGHGHEAVEVDGGVEGDVSVEEGLSAHCDEVATHSQEHVGEQEGDGGCGATGHDDAHHRGLWDSCGDGL